MADIFCDSTVSPYTQIDCGIDQAGIVAMAFIDESTPTPSVTNLEDEAWWTALLAVSPEASFIVTKTRGEYPGGTPTEEDGFGRESTQITGALHEATIEFEGIDENREFVEGINRRKFKVAFVTNGNKVIFVDAPVTSYFKLNIPRGITTAAFYMGTLKWQEYSNPIVADAPANIFDE
jgi:hypothetical protein